MESCLFRGWVQHRRFTPTPNHFRYSVFQVYLDLNELDTVFSGSWLWSARRPACAWFRRADHLGDAARPLADCVRDEVERQTGHRPRGPIRLLTNLRYLGYVINPVSYYYCFDEAGERVSAILAEVHNTPWGERHCYVLAEPFGEDGRPGELRTVKDFHVSPFMQMEMEYRWKLSSPGASLAIHIENVSRSRPVSQSAAGLTPDMPAGSGAAAGVESSVDMRPMFDVTMQLKRVEITPAELRATLLRSPCMTLKVVAAIYWQALKLWWKGVPFVPHPGATEERLVNKSLSDVSGSASSSHGFSEQLDHVGLAGACRMELSEPGTCAG